MVRLTRSDGTTFVAITETDHGTASPAILTKMTDDVADLVTAPAPKRQYAGDVVLASMVTPSEIAGIPNAARHVQSYTGNMNQAVVNAMQKFPDRKRELFRTLTARQWPKHPYPEDQESEE